MNVSKRRTALWNVIEVLASLVPSKGIVRKAVGRPARTNWAGDSDLSRVHLYVHPTCGCLQ